MGGIIRGIGLQAKAFVAALICYYGIGIPLAAVLTLETDLELRGTWIGIATCSVFVNLMFGTLILQSNWNKIL